MTQWRSFRGSLPNLPAPTFRRSRTSAFASGRGEAFDTGTDPGRIVWRRGPFGELIPVDPGAVLEQRRTVAGAGGIIGKALLEEIGRTAGWRSVTLRADQGAKVYGVHLGPVTTPFYEDENPRPIGPNFYFTQEREVQRCRAAAGPEWSILRPDVVVGDAAGNAMNIATVMGACAALSAADGAAFRFPGSRTT